MQDNEIQIREKRRIRPLSLLLAVLISLGLLAAGFGGGYLTRQALLNDELETLDWIITQIKKNYYEDFTDAELIEAAADGVLALLDKYSEYYTDEDYELVKKQAQGYKGGFGLQFLLHNDDRVAVYRTVGGSPAEEAGFSRGDIFFGVRAKGSQDDYTLTPNYTALTNALSSFGDGEEVEFKMLQNNEIKIYYAAKAEYIQNNVKYLTSEDIPELKANEAYIYLESFTGQAANQFASALGSFKADGKSKLVLDLRDNGGGYMDILSTIASYLVQNGGQKRILITEVRYKDGSNTRFFTDDCYYSNYGFEKIVVLFNQNTASASEALLGAMLDYGSISIDDCFGTISYGKGIMQTTFQRSLAGDAIKLTTAKLFWPVSGACIHDAGIVPGTTVPFNYNSIPYGYSNDAQLAKAIQSL